MNLSLKLTFAHSRVQSKDPAWNYQFLLNNYMPLIKMTSGRWPNTFICLANNIYWAKRNFFSPTYIWSDTEMFDRPDVTIVRYVGWGGGSNPQAPVVKKRLVWQITHYSCNSISQCCYKYFSNKSSCYSGKLVCRLNNRAISWS